MGRKHSPKYDLLIIADDNSIIKKWANEVTVEFGNLQKSLKTTICSALDFDEENFILRCKKVLFFTKKGTQSLVKDWLDALRKTKQNDKFLIVNVQPAAAATGPIEGINTSRVVNVSDLCHVSLWWPQVIRLCFGQKTSTKHVYVKNLSENSPKSAKAAEDFKLAIETVYKYGLTGDMWKASSIILFTDNGKPHMDAEFKAKLRDVKLRKVPVHFVMNEQVEVAKVVKFITTSVHTPARPLRAIFWIWSDLKFVKVDFQDRRNPNKVPMPCEPFLYITSDSDWVILKWGSENSEEADEEIRFFHIEFRTVSACAGSGNWIHYGRSMHDGSSETTVKIDELEVGQQYQFKITAENIHGRSESVKTPIITPGIEGMSDMDTLYKLATCCLVTYVLCRWGCRIGRWICWCIG